MPTLFVRHRVDDFDTWRQVYDEVEDLREEFGVLQEAVYQEVGRPDHVLVVHEFDRAEQARRFMVSEKLKQAMDRAGVTEAPQFELCEE